MAAATITFTQVVLAIHILAVVVGFGGVFAFPPLFGALARTDPQVIPSMLRARQRLGRFLINPGLLVVVVAGVYLASKGRGAAALSTVLNSNSINVTIGLLLPAMFLGLGSPSSDATPSATCRPRCRDPRVYRTTSANSPSTSSDLRTEACPAVGEPLRRTALRCVS